MIKAKPHSEYWQRGTDNRNCPKCGRFMAKTMPEQPEDDNDWFYQCLGCDIQVIIQ